MVSNVSPGGDRTPSCNFDVEEESHSIIVKDDFLWKDLSEYLTAYLEKIKLSVVTEAVKKFVDDLVAWLKNPDSQKLDPKKALKKWQNKVLEIVEIPAMTIFWN